MYLRVLRLKTAKENENWPHRDFITWSRVQYQVGFDDHINIEALLSLW